MDDRREDIRCLSFTQFIDAFFQNVRFENCINRGIAGGMLPFRTIGDYLDADPSDRLALLKIPNLGRTSLEAFDQAIQVTLLSKPVDAGETSRSAGDDLNELFDCAELADNIRTKYPLAFDDFLDRYRNVPEDDRLLQMQMESDMRALIGDERAGEVAYRRFLGETLETIGDSLDLTRERVRQIESRFKPLLTDIHTEAFMRRAVNAIATTGDEPGFPPYEALIAFHPLLPAALRRVLLADRSAQGNGPLSGKEQRLLAARLGLAEPEDNHEENTVHAEASSSGTTEAPVVRLQPQHPSSGSSALTQWTNSLLERHGLSLPDRRMLYGYNVSASEFGALESMLVLTCLASSFEQLVSRNPAFPPLFVLFAAEWWKREYDGGPWEWDPIIARLAGPDADISPQLRSRCVTVGLRYWGHQPPVYGNSTHYLGAIVAHGGIPMRLLAQGSGKLPGLLAQVSKFADRYQWTHPQILEAVQERLPMLPGAYRSRDIANLLAEFGETVLQLKQEYKLGRVADPIAYLDQNAGNWKQRFPISLENDAAQALLVGLVREAAAHTVSSSQDLFRCERRLVLGKAGRHRLEAHLVASPRAEADSLAQAFGINSTESLPRYFSIDLECRTRSSFLEARLVLGAEIPAVMLTGRRVVETGSAGIGEHVLILRSAQRDFGERITVPGGGELPEDEPWVFVQREDELVRLVAAGSARLPDAFALVTLPHGWQLEPEGSAADPIGIIDDLGAGLPLYRVEGTFQVHQPGLSYRIRLGQSVEAGEAYQWSGARLPEARGKPVFFGRLPSLYRVGEDGLEKVPLSAQEWRRHGSNTVVSPKEARGPIDVFVHKEGEVVGRQRIVILPPEARIEYLSGAVGMGEVRFSGWGNVEVAVSVKPGMQAHLTRSTDRLSIGLHADGEPPGEFHVLVHWPGMSFELPLWLAFPVTGGRFVSSAGGLLQSGKRIAIRDLIGIRLQVFDTNPTSPKAYELLLVLDSGSRDASLRYPIPLDANGRAEVRLIDYRRHIESLLGMTDLLDSTVTVRLIVGQLPTAELVVARYAFALQLDDQVVRLNERDLAALSPELLEQSVVLASPLVGELAEPVRLGQMQSEGVRVGAWDVKGLFPEGNPWFIYPSHESRLQFRPAIWLAAGDGTALDRSHAVSCPLTEAMLDPDPSTRRDRVHYVVREMSRDASHLSWPLLNRLWATYHHLPLPALDVWRMIAKRPRAVLAMLLRLDLDAAAITDAARRLRDEVGWIPELTAVSDFREAAAGLWAYWQATLPMEVAKTVFLTELETRLRALGREIPSIELLIDLVLFEVSGVASERLQSIWDVCEVNSDVLVRTLWQGQESIGNTLLFLVNAGRDDWGEVRGLFEGPFKAYAESLDETSARHLEPCMRRLFWFQPGDEKFAVANLPILCALWSATSASRSYWTAAGHRLDLKRVRDFDPVWFEQAFHHAFAALLTMGGVIEPRRLLDLPD